MSLPRPLLPATPLLRPGVRVTRRGDGHLQVGLDPELALVVPETGQNWEILSRLAVGDPPQIDSPDAALLFARLVSHDLLVDGDRLRRDLDGPAWRRHAIAHVHATRHDAGRVVSTRGRRPVRVEAPEPFDGLAATLLEASAVPTDGPPYAVLRVAVGEHDRTSVDDLVRDGTGHLLLTLTEGRVRLGPFVIPGVTACLRCLDAHEAETDPRRSLVVAQHAQRHRRLDGVPEPADPAVLTAAVAWAVSDLIAYVDDRMPTTWSATLTLTDGLRQNWHDWMRHPHCGCSWGDELATDPAG